MKLTDLKSQLYQIYDYGEIRQFFHAIAVPKTVGHYQNRKIIYQSYITDITKQFENACRKVRNFYIQTSYGLCDCLGVIYDLEIPKAGASLVCNDKGTDIASVVKGALVGTFFGAMFGMPFSGTTVGSLIGSNIENKENKYEAACRIIKDYSEKMTQLCVDYFSNLIEKEISKGVKETKIDLELGLFYGKRRCPQCGSKLRSINGKNGWFMGCSNINCNFTSKYVPAPKKKKTNTQCDCDLPF